MIRLHDHKRRCLCRVLFFLCGPLPLAVITIWAALTRLPAYLDAELLQLGRQLGLDVSAGSVEYPRPGVVLLRDVRLVAAESGALVAKCPQLRWVRKRNRQRLTTPLVRSSPQGLRRLAQGLLAGPSTGRDCIEFHAARVEIVAATWAPGGRETATHLRQFAIQEQRHSGKPAVLIQFFTSKNQQDGPVRVLARQEPHGYQEMSVAVDTGRAPLACDVLSSLLPAFSTFGTQATFRGCAQNFVYQDARLTSLRGEFDHVDLHVLTRDYCRWTVSGRAKLELRRCILRDGSLQDLQATLRAGPGKLDGQLLRAAGHQLYCPLSQSLAGPDRAAGEAVFDELSMQFTVSADGIRLSGNCRSGPPGSMLVRGGRQLLGQPQYGQLPLSSLVATLTASSADAPSRKAIRLACCLPQRSW